MTPSPRPALPKALLCAMLLLAVQSLAVLVLPYIVPHGAARVVGLALGVATACAFALALAVMMRRRGKPGTAPAQGPLTPPAPQANEAP